MMGAGPSKEDVARGTRLALQHIARKHDGARYVPASHHAAAYVETPNAWRMNTRLIRASNGEAALLFQAIAWDERASPWGISPDVALREIGVSVPA